GMKEGDVFEEIAGEKITSIEQVLFAIQQSNGKSLKMTFRRGEKPVSLLVAPQAKNGNYEVGFQFGRKLNFSDLSLLQSLGLSFYAPIHESGKVLQILKKLFTQKEMLKKVGGPLEIIRQLKISFEDSFVMALMFMFLLNIYLGLFNLLPLPALDGGRLVFILLNILTRRQINQRVETLIHTVGFYLLLGLLLLVTYGDIKRRFGI
ncbi:MAG: M50 family metallopeptidase, partial [Pseudomonadota bacterium]